jgi:hypothetical protein
MGSRTTALSGRLYAAEMAAAVDVARSLFGVRRFIQEQAHWFRSAKRVAQEILLRHLPTIDSIDRSIERPINQSTVECTE